PPARFRSARWALPPSRRQAWLRRRSRRAPRRIAHEFRHRRWLAGDRLRRAGAVLGPLRRPVAVQRADQEERDPDRLLVFQRRRRRDAAGLRDPPPRPGLHRRPGLGAVHLPAQPAVPVARPQGGIGGRPVTPATAPSVADRRVLAWLLLAALVVLGAGLGLRDPWPSDEPRFALVAR